MGLFILSTRIKKTNSTFSMIIYCLKPLVCTVCNDTHFTKEYDIVDKMQTNIRHALDNIKSHLSPTFL